ncbi:MAG: 16S rRNA processing protein RimM [Oscillospiraceae bacterium]|nr:16S rRNA processing protein RimM [Oscillospiraceae bacterium]
MARLLEAGKIVNTHGLRGEMRVLPWADSPAFLTQFHEMTLDGTARKAAVRVQNTCVLVKLDGIDTLDEARQQVGKIVYINTAQAKLPEGALFVQELLGMTAVANGAAVGKITDVISLPKHDVYEITGEKTYLVPAVKQFIKKIDRDAQTVEVELLEGMETDAN